MGVSQVVVAVDGGGSKTDAVALTLDGELAGRSRGPGSSPHYLGLGDSVAIVDRLVREAADGADVVRTGLYLSGLDLESEINAYRAAVASLPWATAGLDVDNDLFALLRAGTDEPDAVAVVCGTGMNAVGVRADGASARFLALGAISGDWGGGQGLGSEALFHAARELDGRGPSTLLTAALEQELGSSALKVAEELHLGEREYSDLARLAPAVFAAAEAGDAVAQALVDRTADEVLAFVRASLDRLDLTACAVPVVLGGGILQAGHARLQDRIANGLAAIAPAAKLVVVSEPPILGAALLALAGAGGAAEALARARTALH
ncbi:MAG TPA: BadF/BadG/BcrA/BcrD ATPase family protein [Propionicimonas sp.]|nr:BadF/BadG/BcrA/BcrD ATPase family protein [Propionicimonas sp.]